MKKNNTKTTERKQRRKTASKARRVRRLAERNDLINRQVARRLKPLSVLLKQQGKQIEELQAKLAAPAKPTTEEKPSE